MELDRRSFAVPQIGAERIVVDSCSFAPLRGITADELFGFQHTTQRWAGHSELLAQLRAVVSITLQEMDRLNGRSPVIPPDSVSRMLELLTRPSTKVALLKKVEGAAAQILGFARVFQRPEDFPDREAIPPEMLNEPCVRFDRFFIVDDGRVFDSRGGAATRLFEGVVALSEGKRIIAKLLVGPDTIDPGWLVAKRALEDRGLEDTGHTEVELFNHSGDEVAPAEFRWYRYPPVTAVGRSKFEDAKTRLRRLELPVRIRLAHTVGHVPLEGGLLLCYSQDPDAWNLAKVHPGNAVVGIASNPEYRWRDERLPNLKVLSADVLESILPAGSAHAVIVFGALPDIAVQSGVTPAENLQKFAALQAAHLIPGQKLLLRDTYRPVTPQRVVEMIVDACGEGVPANSYAERFRQFLELTREAGFLQMETRHVAELPPEPDRADVKSFLVDYNLGKEFQAKAFYQKDMATEAKRFFTAYQLTDIVDALVVNGFRVLRASPEYNGHVIKNHREGRIEFRSVSGTPLPQLPTHVRVVAEKISPDRPVAIHGQDDPKLLRRGEVLEVLVCERTIESWERPIGGRRSLVRRPNTTLDLVPYDVKGDDLWVLARRGFPRPVLQETGPLPDGSIHAPFLDEQISVIVDSEQLTREEDIWRAAVQKLGPRVGVAPADVRRRHPSTWYLPSADITDERVVVVPFQADYDGLRAVRESVGISGFSTDGTRELVSARDLLAGCEVGGISDARLERAVYRLCMDLGLPTGHSLLPELKLTEADWRPDKVVSAAQLLNQAGPPHFRMLPAEDDTFFDVYRRNYIEQFADGSFGTPVPREFARPTERTGYSSHVVEVLPIIKRRDTVLAGVHLSPDMPASAVYGIGAAFPTTPHFLLPKFISNPSDLEAFVVTRFRELFGARFKQLVPLGEPYFVSPGAVPRVCFPYAAEIAETKPSPLKLSYTPLIDLLRHRNRMRCGQLETLTFRAAHILDYIKYAR